MTLPSYVLVTPVRNEAEFIGLTIESVLEQTARPLKWIIVSDGSTDATDEIVQRYTAQHEWIELLRMPERNERNFAGKVYAFIAGKQKVEGLPYEVIANLDGDITFEKDYFSFLLEKLASDPKLGVVGTPYVEKSGDTFDYRFVSIEHVSGACQVFRRECYESIGGYTPVKVGAIDCIAVVTARMKDWKTRTFTDKVCMHHRKLGTAQCGPIRAKFNGGVMDYTMGNHPVWQLFRIAYQMAKRPYVLGGLGLAVGFIWGAFGHEDRPVSREFIEFFQREQMNRLSHFLTNKTWAGRESVLVRGNSRTSR